MNRRRFGGLLLSTLFSPFIRASGLLDKGNALVKASPSSLSDDTSRLQALIDGLPLGGSIKPAKGGYRIDAKRGLRLKSNMNLTRDTGAIISCIPNGLNGYAILMVHNIKNVKISGGKIVGDRLKHAGSKGEWGMGVDIRGSENVVLQAVAINDCWGDGIYIGQGSDRYRRPSEKITIDKVSCENNRRQGVSIVSGEDIYISNSQFNHTNGASPECGIDLEPNRGCSVVNVRIYNCQVLGNAGSGIQFYGNVKKSTVLNTIVENNGRYGVRMAGSNGCTVKGNRFGNNRLSDVYVRKDSVSDCVYSNTGATIHVDSGAREISRDAACSK